MNTMWARRGRQWFTMLLAVCLCLTVAETAEVTLSLDDPVPQTSAFFGQVVAGVGDVDGDGVPDVAVTAAYQDIGDYEDHGRVFVFSGADGDRLLTLDAPTSQDNGSDHVFGHSIAGVGDIDGDDVPDIVVGARRYDVSDKTDTGRGWVFSGDDGTVLLTLDLPTPAHANWLGCSAAAPGDLNGDDVPDIVLGAATRTVSGEFAAGSVFVFSGEDGSVIRTITEPSVQAGTQFGLQVAAPGDIDGDGVGDILVGSPYRTVDGDSNVGQAYVFSGDDGTLIRTLAHPDAEASSYFGLAVSAAGDVDDDGTPDLLVSAPFQDYAGLTSNGTAYVISGDDGSLLQTLYPDDNGYTAIFGEALAAPGDIDGDGHADLAVGARGHNRVYVFSGADGSVLKTIENPDSQANAQFGRSLAVAGDMDDDGIPELIAGAHLQDVSGTADQGRAWIIDVAIARSVEAILIDLIDDLLDLEDSMDGLSAQSLLGKLDGVLPKLTDDNDQNDSAAKSKLEAFIALVKAQRGKALTEEVADDLIAEAEAALDLL